MISGNQLVAGGAQNTAPGRKERGQFQVTLNWRNKPGMLLKTKDREKLTGLEPGMFMKTKDIVALTRTANNSLIFYNIRVVAGSPHGGT